MATLAYIAVTPDGINDATLTAADVLGDSFPADSGKFFKVANGDASPHTVTILAPSATTVCGNFGTVTLSDIVVTVPNGESRIFTIPTGYAADGKFTFAYDAVTSVTVGGFALSPNS